VAIVQTQGTFLDMSSYPLSRRERELKAPRMMPKEVL
jgi:hypothetical protein